MSKTLRILIIFLIVDVVVLGIYFGVKALRGDRGRDPVEEAAWTTMDADFQPATELEQFVKADYEEKGLFPLQFRNHGRNPAVLKRFRGSKLVGAGVSVLEMTFPGLEDWVLVDVWIKGEDDREIRRTILYVLTANAWKVGDSGRLAD